MVEGGGFENRCAVRYRGFESPLLRTEFGARELFESPLLDEPRRISGEMTERPKVYDWKSYVPGRVPRVQIPLSP